MHSDKDSAYGHGELCRLALAWLKRPRSRGGPACLVVASEIGNGWNNGEIPDAIGFRAGVSGECSVLVEVKTSRADFLADHKKRHRQNPARGMGSYRYFLAPEGLLNPDDLPERWGLIEVTPRRELRVRSGHVKGEALRWVFAERNIGREWALLTRMLHKTGDTDKTIQALKEAARTKERLIREKEKLRIRCEQLALRLAELEWNGQPPRMRSSPPEHE